MVVLVLVVTHMPLLAGTGQAMRTTAAGQAGDR
jgi:hypothetical protein